MDDKKYPPKDRQMWNESDVKEWSQWMKNGSVRIMTTEEERNVPQCTINGTKRRRKHNQEAVL